MALTAAAAGQAGARYGRDARAAPRFDTRVRPLSYTQTPNRLHLFSGCNGLAAGYPPVIDNSEDHPYEWETVAETLEKGGITWRVLMQSDYFDDVSAAALLSPPRLCDVQTAAARALPPHTNGAALACSLPAALLPLAAERISVVQDVPRRPAGQRVVRQRKDVRR